MSFRQELIDAIKSEIQYIEANGRDDWDAGYIAGLERALHFVLEGGLVVPSIS